MLERVLIYLGVLVPSVILHEIAHGLAALRFGDDTAKRAGRLTLNPVSHVDVFGTLILPGMLALSGLGIFGYAKPVPVNPARMRRPRDHSLVVSLVGPATNIALSVLAILAYRYVVGGLQPGEPAPELLLRVIGSFGVVNVILAAFNLLPIPPLDGSAVIERFLPRRLLGPWHRLRQYSMAILLVLVLLLPGVLGTVFGAAIDLWSAFL